MEVLKLGIKTRNLNLIFVVIVSYIVIKLIDNYSAILMGLDKIINIINPFIMAFIIAYALNPLVSFVERKFKFKRAVSILITYIIILLLMVFFVSKLSPIILQSIEDIIRNIPVFLDQSNTWINNVLKNTPILGMINDSNSFEKGINNYLPKIGNILTFLGNAIITNTIALTTSFVNIIFGFIIAIYILFDKEKFIWFGKKIIYAVLKPKKGKLFLEFIKNLNYTFYIYIGARALDSVVVGIICFVGISLLKSKYALLVALICAVTNMIPYFGPVVGMVVAFSINVFYRPMTAIWVLIFLIILQQFDGWYLDPKITGDKVGMNAFLTILAVTIGGGLFGVWGMLLGVPVMAVIKIQVEKLIENVKIVEKNN